tara:strand:+ start:16740 stop:17705 length:966 start_codon:yes stop_codon:yes gene_type:complete
VNILFPDIHLNLTKNIARALSTLGHTLILPSKDYVATHRPPAPVNDFVWNETWDEQKIKKHFNTDNVTCLNKEQILDLKPDVVFITAYENQFEILEELYPHLREKSKIAMYSGNSYWPEAYPIDRVDNFLCADWLSYHVCLHNKKNYLYYRPWVDYETFNFKGSNSSNILGSYISNFSKAFPDDYKYCNYLKDALDFLDIKLHSNITHEEVPIEMEHSMATLHVKKMEGYGYAIIESMASGRPVFLYSKYSGDKSYQQWAIENVTALYFSDAYELHCKAKAMLESEDYRHHLQHTCAENIRKLINNEEQTDNLKHFLENLK